MVRLWLGHVAPSFSNMAARKAPVLAPKLPVTVITGFLGSGKTTLLNYILSAQHGKRIAVIENEFGEVGVDDALVKQKFKEDEDIFEMNNGCICCTVRGDLIRILKSLASKRSKFDYVLIETTGLADPAPVAQTFFVDDDIQELYELDGIVTVVDAKHILLHLDEVKPDGVENEAVEQVAFADRIIINKIDLVSEEELSLVKSKVHAINKYATTLTSTKSIIDLDSILRIHAFDLARVTRDLDPQFLVDQEHSHDLRTSSVGVKLPGAMNLAKLQMWISTLLRTQGTNLYRYKGILNVAGVDRKYVFQGVHMLFGGSFEDEWSQGEERQSIFCFIGRDLERETLISGFNDCLAGPLRFKVGDRVACSVEEGRMPGVIKALWDEGNPYRVQLDLGQDVWAPVDEDAFIMAHDGK